MPRIARMIIPDEKAVYHVWDVETDPNLIPQSNHFLS